MLPLLLGSILALLVTLILQCGKKNKGTGGNPNTPKFKAKGGGKSGYKVPPPPIGEPSKDSKDSKDAKAADAKAGKASSQGKLVKGQSSQGKLVKGANSKSKVGAKPGEKSALKAASKDKQSKDEDQKTIDGGDDKKNKSKKGDGSEASEGSLDKGGPEVPSATAACGPAETQADELPAGAKAAGAKKYTELTSGMATDDGSQVMIRVKKGSRYVHMRKSRKQLKKGDEVVDVKDKDHSEQGNLSRKVTKA